MILDPRIGFWLGLTAAVLVFSSTGAGASELSDVFGAVIGAKISGACAYLGGMATLVVGLLHGVPSGNAPNDAQKFYMGPKPAVVAFIVSATLATSWLLMPGSARAADAAKPVPKLALAAFTPCTPIACTGWYGGFNIAGISTNVNVLAGGINGSVAAGGQNIGVQGGYQFWNGTYFFGPEVAIDYTYGGTSGPVAGQSSPHYLAEEIIKLGTPFSTFFGSAPAPANTTGLSSILTANTIAPYIFFGAAQSGWGTTGMVGGAGVTFAIDQQHWFVDARYENYQFPSGASNCATGQSCPSINVVKVGLDYKF